MLTDDPIAREMSDRARVLIDMDYASRNAGGGSQPSVGSEIAGAFIEMAFALVFGILGVLWRMLLALVTKGAKS